MSPKQPWHWQSLILILVGAVLFAVFAFTAINKPITTDEVEFSAAALAIAQTGKPIYYMGDTPSQYWPAKDMWQKQEEPRPEFKYGLWHAPLYVYLLGLCHLLFGTANWVARLPGLLCYLATLWLLRGIIQQVYPTEKAQPIFGVVAFLYLINPLLIQEGLMLDVDNTVVTATSVLFLHEFVRMERRETEWLRKYAWLSVLIALTFWAKEFAGAYLALSVLVYVGLQKRWKEMLGVLGMLIVGAILFWCTWWVFCKLTGLPVMYFIRFTILGKLAIGEGLFQTIAKQSGLRAAVSTIGFSFMNTSLWVSPYYLVLLVMAIGWRGMSWWRNRQLDALDLLLLYVLIVLAATQAYRPSGWYLKYEYPAHGPWLLLVGAYLYQKAGGFRREDLFFAGIAALLIAFIQVDLIQDPVHWLFNGGPSKLAEYHVTTFYVVVAVVLIGAVKLGRPDWRLSQVCAGALVVGIVGANLGLDWKQRGPGVTSISWNNYGETGFTKASAHLKASLGPNDVPICRKDFGFYLFKDLHTPMRRFINPAVLTEVKTTSDLVRNITAPQVSHIVLDRYSNRSQTSAVIQQYYQLDQKIGEFYILRRVR